MRLGLVRTALGAALLLVSPLAGAEDAGVRGGEDDVDGGAIACDGALCETQTGTTCDLAGVSPGRFSPSCADGFAILATLSLAAGLRRTARRPALDLQRGVAPTQAEQGGLHRPARSESEKGRRKGHNKHGLL
jgi:hypothetical protein